MADRPAPNFTARAARRIARVVRATERAPAALDGDAAGVPPGRETMVMGRLLTKPSPGRYTWTEVRRKEDGTWVEKAGGRKGESDAGLAVPQTGTGDADGEYEYGSSSPPVLLKRSSVEQTDGSFKLRWVVIAPGGGGPPAKWGKVTSYAPGSNSVTLQPCDAAGTSTGAPTVTVYVTLPASRSYCSFAMILAGDVLAYTELDGVRWLASVPLPYSTDTGKVYQITATSGTGGFDNVRMR